MRLDQNYSDLFLVTIPAFVASLPPASGRKAGVLDTQSLLLQTSVVELRCEMTRLRETYTNESAEHDMNIEDHHRAASVLEDVLNLLENLVDNAILNHTDSELVRIHYIPRRELKHALTVELLIVGVFPQTEDPYKVNTQCQGSTKSGRRTSSSSRCSHLDIICQTWES